MSRPRRKPRTAVTIPAPDQQNTPTSIYAATMRDTGINPAADWRATIPATPAKPKGGATS